MEGACSCGEITVKVPSGREVGMCHCVDCRKAGGNTYGISVDLPKSQFQMTGTPKVYAVKGMSGKEIRRYFCGTCGSPIYVECDLDIKEGSDDWTVSVKIGLFPPKTIPRPTKHLFAKDMEDWERPVEGAEVLETQ